MNKPWSAVLIARLMSLRTGFAVTGTDQETAVFRSGKRIYLRKPSLSVWIERLEAQQNAKMRLSDHAAGCVNVRTQLPG